MRRVEGEDIQKSRTRTRSSDDFSEVQHGTKDLSPSARRPTHWFDPPRVGVGVVVEPSTTPTKLA
jgi:hypothetical protein